MQETSASRFETCWRLGLGWIDHFVGRGTAAFAGAAEAVIDATSRVHWQKVKLGRDFGAQVEISEGLAEGARLVATPSDAMVEGQPVAPIAAPVAEGKKD